jgi:hypothetical protein
VIEFLGIGVPDRAGWLLRRIHARLGAGQLVAVL